MVHQKTSNGWNKANVVDGLGTLRFSSLNDNPEDRASAFYFQHKIRPQYIDMTADYDNADEQCSEDLQKER